ncbi:hypothetical protein QR680_010188 [Steinernema hermaphroditum]|uniref:TAZ-type domain-containing protein n=1 Tax=Steinernema hermaphroditum TaxID=289476 RepID=A0AA39IPZ8_9BILA|nr:hypothetical protein QR680_010188 [Steinernema hermaphroditum]
MAAERRLQVCRNYLKLIIHACECRGCCLVTCSTLQGLLGHLQDCHDGSQCAEYSKCYQVRMAVIHACNCVYPRCKLCLGIIDNDIVDILPKLDSTVRDAEPARIASMVGMDVEDLFDLERDKYVEVVELDDDEEDVIVLQTSQPSMAQKAAKRHADGGVPESYIPEKRHHN